MSPSPPDPPDVSVGTVRLHAPRSVVLPLSSEPSSTRCGRRTLGTPPYSNHTSSRPGRSRDETGTRRCPKRRPTGPELRIDGGPPLDPAASVERTVACDTVLTFFDPTSVSFVTASSFCPRPVENARTPFERTDPTGRTDFSRPGNDVFAGPRPSRLLRAVSSPEKLHNRFLREPKAASHGSTGRRPGCRSGRHRDVDTGIWGVRRTDTGYGAPRRSGGLSQVGPPGRGGARTDRNGPRRPPEGRGASSRRQRGGPLRTRITRRDDTSSAAPR